jgi:hypothetical protein
MLSAYTGPSVSALSLVGTVSKDVTGACPEPRLFLDTTAGTTYQLQVDGFDVRATQEGVVNIHLVFRAFPQGPTRAEALKKCKHKHGKARKKCKKKASLLPV